jgi:hypothetical protein
MDPSDLLGSLMGQLRGGGIEQIGRSVGLDSGDVSKVLAGAMPAILAGLTRNTSSSAGAAGLLDALDRNHDGSVLDDVMGYLGGGGNLADGAGILGHVLGGRQAHVEKAISASSGVDPASVGKILAMVAPLLMGALGKAKRDQGLDASGLAAVLGQQQKIVSRASPSAVDLFSKILDSDGDGDPMDDVVKMGSGLLGGLFKN